ncbi:MAG: AEC family transporter, partial [Traorella sp.]
LVPQRFMAYVAGEGIFNPHMEKKTFQQMILNIITNKVVIALCFGILIALSSISLPLFFMNALQGVSKCMSPLSLILVGSILAEKFHLDIHEDIKIIILSCLRQFIIPLLVLFTVKQMKLDTMVQAIVVLLVGMPIASTTAIYAHKYHNGDGFASKAVFVSTISSILTLVILMGIIESVL